MADFAVTNAIGPTEGAVFIPELWSDEIVATYEANLVVGALATMFNHNGQKGDTFHIPAPTRGSASAKTHADSVALINNVEAEISLSIDKHYEYSRLVEDILRVQGLDTLRTFYTADAGYALSTQVDTDMWGECDKFVGAVTDATPTTRENSVIGSNGSTAWDPGASTNTGNGAALADAGIRRMIRVLDDNNVPQSQRQLVIPPVEKESLTGIARFTEQAYVGEVGAANTVRSGRIGDLYGVPVYVSTNTPSFNATDASTAYRSGAIFHKSAIALIMQQDIRIQTQYKLEYLSTLMVGDVLYGVGTLRGDAGVSFVVPA